MQPSAAEELSDGSASVRAMTHIQMVTIDCANPGKLAEFWTAAMDTTVANDMGGEFVILAPTRTGGVSLALQKVPEPRSGKNRVHIDFGTQDRAADVAKLVELGATVVDEHTMPGFAWTVLADPEGNEFCVGGEEK
jgi:predicted enzyme related to lactoylglutathione lyase